MKWDFMPARRAFEDARSQWNDLNTARGNHILLDSIFVESALRHFGNGRTLLGVKTDSRKPGLGMFQKRGTAFWETFQPSQAPIGLVLLPAENNVREEIAGLVHSLPGWALQLSILQQDPDYAMVPAAIEDQRFETLNYIETARVAMTGTFEGYWKARSINLRHNVSRRRRRMLEKGFVPELWTLREADAVAGALKSYAALESKGWKAQGGTAVTADNAQGRFYREIFEQFCARGEAVVYQFRVNGEVIATDLCLMRNKVMIVLKTTYDEDWNEYSPALLMREEITKQLFAEGHIDRIEFYGRVMAWHRQWTDDIRTMYHVNCYRDVWVRSLKAMTQRIRSRGSQREAAALQQSVGTPSSERVGQGSVK